MCLVAIHLARHAGLVATVHASEEGCCPQVWRAKSRGNRITEPASVLRGQAEGVRWMPMEPWTQPHVLNRWAVVPC
jgi:hypothetical protein